MEYNEADTIAIRLSKTNPWRFDEHTRSWPTPMYTCAYCHYGRYVNEPNMYNSHDPACLWVAAARYADELDNAPVGDEDVPDGHEVALNMNTGYLVHSPSCHTCNAPVASREPAESPIESRVSELLGETESDDSGTFWCKSARFPTFASYVTAGKPKHQ
jgi:hypothetical protein